MSDTPTGPSSSRTTGMRNFNVIWTGQLVSMIGSGLTGFGLSVWIYEKTDSASLFALTALALVLPGILLLPWTGVLADKWNRRTVMLLSDAGGLLTALMATALFTLDRVEVWHVCLINALITTCDSIRSPAWSAAIATLVSSEQLPRANGMMQSSFSFVQIAVPLGGSALLGLMGMRGLLLLDAASFIFAVITLLFARMPGPETYARSTGRRTMREDFVQGWSYLVAHRGLLLLLALGFVIHLALVMSQVTMTPLLLAAGTPMLLGIVSSAGGLGGLLGSVAMGSGRVPGRRILVIFVFTAIEALAIAALGLIPPGPTLALDSFFCFGCMPFIHASLQLIWQRKTAIHLQGRVFALKNVTTLLATPLAFLTVSALVDPLLEPLMGPGGALASSLGPWVGTGKGRGSALLLVGLGALLFVGIGLSSLSPRLRRVEEDLPDALPEENPRLAVPATGEPT